MTRGEYIYQKKHKMLTLLEEGKIKFQELEDFNAFAGAPKQMPFRTALAYYTKKLRQYWEQKYER